MGKMKEIINSRVSALRTMDKHIREVVGDEDITEVWLMNGLPDEASEEDIIEIASDDDLFCGIVDCYNTCLALLDEDEEEKLAKEIIKNLNFMVFGSYDID